MFTGLTYENQWDFHDKCITSQSLPVHFFQFTALFLKKIKLKRYKF